MEEIFKGEDLSGLTESRRRPQWAIEEAAGFICLEDSRFNLEADQGSRRSPWREREWTLESVDLSSEEDYQMRIKEEEPRRKEVRAFPQTEWKDKARKAERNGFGIEAQKKKLRKTQSIKENLRIKQQGATNLQGRIMRQFGQRKDTPFLVFGEGRFYCMQMPLSAGCLQPQTIFQYPLSPLDTLSIAKIEDLLTEMHKFSQRKIIFRGREGDKKARETILLALGHNLILSIQMNLSYSQLYQIEIISAPNDDLAQSIELELESQKKDKNLENESILEILRDLASAYLRSQMNKENPIQMEPISPGKMKERLLFTFGRERRNSAADSSFEREELLSDASTPLRSGSFSFLPVR